VIIVTNRGLRYSIMKMFITSLFNCETCDVKNVF